MVIEIKVFVETTCHNAWSLVNSAGNDCQRRRGVLILWPGLWIFCLAAGNRHPQDADTVKNYGGAEGHWLPVPYPLIGCFRLAAYETPGACWKPQWPDFGNAMTSQHHVPVLSRWLQRATGICWPLIGRMDESKPQEELVGTGLGE